MKFKKGDKLTRESTTSYVEYIQLYGDKIIGYHWFYKPIYGWFKPSSKPSTFLNEGWRIRDSEVPIYRKRSYPMEKEVYTLNAYNKVRRICGLRELKDHKPQDISTTT